ncbi:MAG: MTAP family purine nucleoside phosphorylase [Armatimonadota bacterium]
MIAIIGGTGFTDWMASHPHKTHIVSTIDGDQPVYEIMLDGVACLFVPRHGTFHDVLPHNINSASIVRAVQQMGATGILATFAVGSLTSSRRTGEIVVLSDFLDFTHKRRSTLFEVEPHKAHTDFSQPFCPLLRQALIEASHSLRLPVHSSGTYLCVDGPRYETPAEVRLFAQLGADVVGMTLIPEIVFAKELGIPYAGVAVITNMGTGLTSESLAHENISDNFGEVRTDLTGLLQRAILQDAGGGTKP